LSGVKRKGSRMVKSFGKKGARRIKKESDADAEALVRENSELKRKLEKLLTVKRKDGRLDDGILKNKRKKSKISGDLDWSDEVMEDDDVAEDCVLRGDDIWTKSMEILVDGSHGINGSKTVVEVRDEQGYCVLVHEGLKKSLSYAIFRVVQSDFIEYFKRKCKLTMVARSNGSRYDKVEMDIVDANMMVRVFNRVGANMIIRKTLNDNIDWVEGEDLNFKCWNNRVFHVKIDGPDLIGLPGGSKQASLVRKAFGNETEDDWQLHDAGELVLGHTRVGNFGDI